MNLATPITVTVANRSISTLTPRYTDAPSGKLCSMMSPGMLRPLVLWKGADYDAIGDWTEAQAEARIAALAASGDLAKCFLP